MLSDGRDRSDWVKNLRRTPEVTVRIAHVVEKAEEDDLARRLLVEKHGRNPGSLGNWRRNALPVAVALMV